jgi:STE24 endopeptidase
MHPITVIILAALLIDAVVSVAADFLNLKSVRTRLPKAFEGLYDPQRYTAAQRYLRVNTRFGWVTAAVNLAVLLLFWFSGGFQWLDAWVRGLGHGDIVNGLLYIGILVACKALIELPFGIYATFGIEARFGFNQTTWKTYLSDRIKGALLAILLGGPLLALILAFFLHAGPLAWFYCWAATVGFMLLMQYIAPTWIMPLFNRFEPLEEGALNDAIMAYARSIDFALDRIFVMDGSKRSSKSNAFFTGFGRHRRIVLFDTLVEKHTTEELVAVLAHEMGHYKKKHIIKNLLVGIVQAGVMFFILSLFISYPGLFAAFHVQEVSVYAGLIFFGLLYAPLDGLTGIALQALSRKHEYEADRFAVQTSQNGPALITALKKLTVDNLSNLQPHPFYVFLNYSHPPILNRIQAIEKAI